MQLTKDQCDKLQGKTILNIEHLGVNEIIIRFTDKTILTLDVECVNSSIGLYGISAISS